MFHFIMFIATLPMYFNDYFQKIKSQTETKPCHIHWLKCFFFSERDQFLKTMGKRISDTDIMKNVCLAMEMKSHQIESHLTNYSRNINEAAYEAFLRWWTENTTDNKPERELLTILKEVCRYYPILLHGRNVILG